MKQTAQSAWMRFEELNNEAAWDVQMNYIVGGFDAADSTDLNAAKAIYMRQEMCIRDSCGRAACILYHGADQAIGRASRGIYKDRDRCD